MSATHSEFSAQSDALGSHDSVMNNGYRLIDFHNERCSIFKLYEKRYKLFDRNTFLNLTILTVSIVSLFAFAPKHL